MEDKMLVIFIATIGCASVGACISSLFCWFDYWRMKKEKDEEIEHLKKEVKACRFLLKRRSIRDG